MLFLKGHIFAVSFDCSTTTGLTSAATGKQERLTGRDAQTTLAEGAKAYALTWRQRLINVYHNEQALSSISKSGGKA